jgi:hypothetical protein
MQHTFKLPDSRSHNIPPETAPVYKPSFTALTIPKTHACFFYLTHFIVRKLRPW